ncbi:ATP-dependent sacrificial sulfur transferase LarE [Corynebacterium lubricantis]|uniref:ATP-dependent sacrificial sulfur transferase LarE n=1 Tax=Corynebacterium lubricantis TaxID=541095 RepID=UPI00035C2BA6|nr:ATP-dependent sacrificial sulfur transferase LarE [Corynebacterium lubricantis]
MSLTQPDPVAQALINKVIPHFPRHGRVGIAYSGGVDSATLLAIAHYALGAERTLGITAISHSFAARERAMARDTANQIGARVIEVETHEDEIEGYIANDVDRCYFCKDEMFEVIDQSVVDKHDLVAVAYGENADDAVRVDRPGARAATEHNVLRPLAAAGLTKAEVRQIAAAFGLKVADKPAAPCLASRVPHGLQVNPEKLAQIEALELTLYELGFSDSRVRHHDSIARIELPQDEMVRAMEPEIADKIRESARAAGFTFATVDLKGIQSGAMTLAALNKKGKLNYVGADTQSR